jgi:thioredoxin
MSDNVIHVNDQDFAQAILDSDLPVLVDFWADWCGPCHIVAPVVEEIAREHAGTLRVATLNVDENPYTAQQYGRRPNRWTPTSRISSMCERKTSSSGAVQSKPPSGPTM